MVKAVLQFADSAILEASKRGNWQRADVLLREAVAMLLGFFAMRRSDELFVNKTHTHGLLQKHIVYNSCSTRRSAQHVFGRVGV